MAKRKLRQPRNNNDTQSKQHEADADIDYDYDYDINERVTKDVKTDDAVDVNEQADQEIPDELEKPETPAPKENAELSHQDMWDDTELVQMWQATIHDYKKAHKGQGIPLDPNDVKEFPKWVQASETVEETIALMNAKVGNEPATVADSQEHEASSQDLLENIMRSWYSVGYYTGLYQARLNNR